jgi:hypothetical protein
MAFYERLIRRGIAEADVRGSAIDHVTARRLALWLIPRSQQEPEFMRGLIYFARTGGVPDSLRQALRRQARSPAHPSRPQAAWLLQYAVARGRDTGRIGDNFGAACDQMDHADAILEDLRRERGNPEPTEQDWRDAIPLKPVALARRDEVTRSVTFILDAKVAEAAVQAITAEAMAREARIRQTRQQAADLSQGSYGRRNREDIAARETAIADGLRAIERAYRQALEPAPATEFSYLTHPRKAAAEHDLELE